MVLHNLYFQLLFSTENLFKLDTRFNHFKTQESFSGSFSVLIETYLESEANVFSVIKKGDFWRLQQVLWWKINSKIIFDFRGTEWIKLYKYFDFYCRFSVSDFEWTTKLKMKSSVTRKQNAVMILLVTGALSGIFTHASDACQTADDSQNDSKFNHVNIQSETCCQSTVFFLSLFTFLQFGLTSTHRKSFLR